MISHTSIVLRVLVTSGAIPSLGRHAFNAVAKIQALKTHCGTSINLNCIAKYRHRLVAFDDHEHHWKLRNIDTDDCTRIVETYGLQPAEHERLFSRTHSPSWWPKSTDGYTIFEGDDGRLGNREIWVTRGGATVYLFKFTE